MEHALQNPARCTQRVVGWLPVLLSGLLAFIISVAVGTGWHALQTSRAWRGNRALPSVYYHTSGSVLDRAKRVLLPGLLCAATFLLPIIMMVGVREWVGGVHRGCRPSYPDDAARNTVISTSEGSHLQSTRIPNPLNPVSGLVVFIFATSACFKAVQALTGTLTPGATRHGLEFWLVYYCSPVEPTIQDLDAVEVLPTFANRKRRIWQVVWTGAALSLLLSYGRAAGHFAKDTTVDPAGAIYVGVTWSLAINHAMSLAQLMVAELGYLPCTAFRAPYMLAESPHDFWGNRLDLAFQMLLKRSFYYPVRKFFSGAKKQSSATGVDGEAEAEGARDDGSSVSSGSGGRNVHVHVHSEPDKRSRAGLELGSGLALALESARAELEAGAGAGEGVPPRKPGGGGVGSEAAGAIFATLATFTASGIMHELLWVSMMQSVKERDVVRLGMNVFECRPDGRSTLYFVVQGLICVASTVIVRAIPTRSWKAIPQVVKLYITLALGPWIGLHWYLDKLSSCGYWTGLLELYPTVPLSAETLDSWVSPTVLQVVPREFAVHGAALAAVLAWKRYYND